MKFIQLIKLPSQSVWILNWGKAVWYIKQKWTSVFPKVATTPCSLNWRRFHACLLLVLSRHRLMLCTVLIWFTHYSPKALISNLWLLLWSRTANKDMLNYLALQLLFKAVFLEGKNTQGLFYNFCSESLYQYFMPPAGGFIHRSLFWGLTPPSTFVHELQRDHYLRKFVYSPKLPYE